MSADDELDPGGVVPTEEPTGEPTGESSGEPAAEPARPDPLVEEHHADGLDLARALTRAAARAGGTPARRKRSGPRRTSARASGSHPDDRDPQLLDDVVSRLVDDHGWELDLRVHGVFGRWAELVGPEVAQHCTPESFADGKLVVRTDSTAWATQLRLLAPTVVRRLNEELGHGTVTVIDVLGPHLPTWKKGPRSARDGRGPRDTYG
jgi:predicted nucleic acid-binding Zn ribbon protein